MEKLRSMIGLGGGSGGDGIANSKEIDEMKEKLKISEMLMSEMTKSWEQKLMETERIHQERQKALENMGISVQAAGIGVQVDKFYLVNLNADPSMNELLVCYLKVSYGGELAPERRAPGGVNPGVKSHWIKSPWINSLIQGEVYYTIVM